MDVISLSKANKTLNKIKQLDESVVAPLAEDRFPTVDARLDWLEGQAAKIKAENSKQIDLSQGTFINTELVNGKIQLKQIGVTNTGVQPAMPFMTSNNSPSPYVITASSSDNGIDLPYRAFDGNDSTIWKSGNNYGGGWLQVDLGVPKKIIEYDLQGVSYYPVDWKIEGSNTGLFSGEQVIVDVRTGQNTSIKQTYTISNSGEYRYYRLTVIKTFNAASAYDRLRIATWNLKESGIVPIYVAQGTWESPIVDLGEGWKETKLIDIVKQIHIGTTDVSFEIATSTDGISFTSYTPLDLNNLPQGRYIKLRATLSAQAQSEEVKTLDFNQSSPENIMNLNEYVEANGRLRLKNTYIYNMTDDGALGAGKQFSITINKANFKSIESIGVN